MEERGGSKPKTCQHYLLIRIQTACCATERIKATSLKESKRLERIKATSKNLKESKRLQRIKATIVQMRINEDF